MKNKKHPFLLSVIADEISQDPVIAMDLAAEHGLDGIELRSAWDTPAEKLSDEQLNKLMEEAGKRGLKISGIASSFLKDDWGNDDRAKFDALIRVCHACKCDHLRGFSFWANEDYTDEKFAAYLAEYDAILEKEGIVLTLENDPSVNLSTGFDLARFFSAHNFRNIGIFENSFQYPFAVFIILLLDCPDVGSLFIITKSCS